MFLLAHARTCHEAGNRLTSTNWIRQQATAHEAHVGSGYRAGSTREEEVGPWCVQFHLVQDCELFCNIILRGTVRSPGKNEGGASNPHNTWCAVSIAVCITPVQ